MKLEAACTCEESPHQQQQRVRSDRNLERRRHVKSRRRIIPGRCEEELAIVKKQGDGAEIDDKSTPASPSVSHVKSREQDARILRSQNKLEQSELPSFAFDRNLVPSNVTVEDNQSPLSRAKTLLVQKWRSARSLRIPSPLEEGEQPPRTISSKNKSTHRSHFKNMKVEIAPILTKQIQQEDLFPPKSCSARDSPAFTKQTYK